MPRTRQTTSSRQSSKRVKRSSRTPQTDVQAPQPDLHVQVSKATQQIAPALQPPLSMEARQHTTSAPQMALNMQATHLPALAPQPAHQMPAYLSPAQPPQQSPQPTAHQFGEDQQVIWVFGSSIIKRAFVASFLRPGGSDLNLDRLNITLWWQGYGGLEILVVNAIQKLQVLKQDSVIGMLVRHQKLVPNLLFNSHSSHLPGHITTNPQDIHNQYTINSKQTRPLLSTRGGLADPLPGTGAPESVGALRTCRLVRCGVYWCGNGCYPCYLSSKLNESCCLPFCLPGFPWLIALRVKMRAENNIQGSIMNDCCCVCCCSHCVMCQLSREHDYTLANPQTY
uniref:Cornifelin-like protein n=1 Tax=Magallana gigas TaxID=29159 RepID=K1RYA9_MAGGI